MTPPTFLDSRLRGNDMVGMVLLCVMPACLGHGLPGSVVACPSFGGPDLIGHPEKASGAIEWDDSFKGMR